MTVIAIIVALIFLVTAILAIGKMHDAQKDFEEFHKNIDEILSNETLPIETKIQRIWELL